MTVLFLYTCRMFLLAFIDSCISGMVVTSFSQSSVNIAKLPWKHISRYMQNVHLFANDLNILLLIVDFRTAFVSRMRENAPK